MLRHVPLVDDVRVLVDQSTRDDAAVFRISDDRAIVATVDFFAPIVDDPYTFGAISAANSLSDVYAMGGRPLYALNVVGWPRTQPFALLGEILAGGAEAAREAECPIVGGHSVDDLEPKYGLAVTGLVHPRRILSNAGAKPGDVLLLGKALGTGIAVSAIKKGNAPPDLVKAATAQMRQLNRGAGEVYARNWKSVHALTDVTGFGLLGHLMEICRGSRLSARLSLDAIPVLSAARHLAEAGYATGAASRNWETVGPHTTLPSGTAEWRRKLLVDPQTSGGLLVACDPATAPAVLEIFKKQGFKYATQIGALEGGAPGIVVD